MCVSNFTIGWFSSLRTSCQPQINPFTAKAIKYICATICHTHIHTHARIQSYTLCNTHAIFPSVGYLKLKWLKYSYTHSSHTYIHANKYMHTHTHTHIHAYTLTHIHILFIWNKLQLRPGIASQSANLLVSMQVTSLNLMSQFLSEGYLNLVCGEMIAIEQTFWWAKNWKIPLHPQ